MGVPLIGKLLGIGEAVVNRIVEGDPNKLSDQEQAELAIEIDRIAADRASVLVAAQRDIITAELKQDDTLTKRIRPLSIAAFVLAFLFNWVLRPIWAEPVVFPALFDEILLGLLGVYFVGRSGEKMVRSRGGGEKTAGGDSGSAVSQLVAGLLGNR